MMRFNILGPLQVFDGDQIIEVTRPKQRALLAVLLLNANRPISPDRLIDELWNGDPPPQAAASLQAYVSHLRRLLDDRGGSPRVLVLEPAGYVLRIEAGSLDATRFEDVIEEARIAMQKGVLDKADRLYEEGLELWRGEFLPEMAHETFARDEATRFSELRLSAIEERTKVRFALGRHREVVGELERMVRSHPLREGLRELLALGLYRAGRQAEALQRIGEGREMLAEELGIDPGPRLRELEIQILQQSPELDWSPAADEVTTAEEKGAAYEDDPDPLVGRERELEALGGAWKGAVKGNGGVALIAGEPGIGKTRLAKELTSIAAGEGRVYWGRCFEGGGAPAFWPWLQLLESVSADLDDATLRAALGSQASEVALISLALAERLPDIEPAVAGDAPVARFRLYDAVTRFLLKVAADRPVAIVLDDIHWADQPSLELLRLLAERLQGVRLLVVATFRDSAADLVPALTETLASLARAESVRRIALDGLAVDDVQRLIDIEVGSSSSGEFASEVHARSEGNPFFVRELARLLEEEGGSGEPARRVPAGVLDVVGRRVALQPESTVEILEAAAVVGRDFPVAIVAQALETRSDLVLEALEPAAEAGLVVSSDRSLAAYRFAHALVREAIYERLPRVRRSRLHGLAGDAIENLGDETRLSEAAHHYEQAAPLGFAEKAVNAAIKASDVALAMLAYEQAEEHLQGALRVLGQISDPERELAVQTRLVWISLMIHGYPTGRLRRAADRVLELAPEVGETPEVIGVIWALWSNLCVRAEFDAALDIARELAAIGDRREDRCALAAAAQARATTLWHLGRLHESDAAFREAASIVAELPFESVAETRLQHMVTTIPVHWGVLRCLLDESDVARRELESAREIVDRSERQYDRAFIRHGQALTHLLNGDLAASVASSREALELCERHGFRLLEVMGSVYLGCAESLQGDGNGGIARMEAALERFHATEALMLQHFFQALLAEAYLSCGRDADALAAVEEGIAASDKTGEAFYLSDLFRLKGEVLLRAGDESWDEARIWLARAAETAEDQGATALARRARGALDRD